jgi:MFS family permease
MKKQEFRKKGIMKKLKLKKINPKFPFPIYKVPFFYGWVILGLGAVTFLMTIPGQTVGVSVFTDFLIDVLNISRNTLSFSYFVGTIMSAIVLTFAGKIYDKAGDRIIGTLVALSMGIVLFFMSNIDNIVNIITKYINFLPSNIVIIIIMCFAFFSLRFLGQGVLALVSRNIVMKWFDKKRGFANAILGTFISFGMAYAPGFLNELIENYNWNGAWGFLSKVIGIAFVIVFFLVARDNPGECNLIPDGTGKVKKEKIIKENNTKKNFKLNEAIKTYTFWIFAFAISMHALYLTAVTFHIVSIFSEAGFEREVAVSIFLPIGIISVIVNFVASWASDFIKLKYFLSFHLTGLILSMIAVINLGSDYSVILLIIGNGLSGGLFGLISTLIWPKYYGIKYLGAISSFAMGFTVAGSAIGPYIFSMSLSYLGAYTYAAMFLLVVSVVLLVLSLKANKPKVI